MKSTCSCALEHPWKGMVFISPLLVIFLSIVFVMPIWAGELAFPGSESEIVEAMQFRDGLFTIDGQAYESKDGRVYKIINGNHYRMRGLRVLADTDIVPKTGALILFDFGTTDIRPESLPLLEEYAKAFAGNLSQARFMICGHTDSSGDRAYNQQLSESRARSVAAYLAEHHGIDADRFDIVGYGEDRPIADNHSSGGRLKNRRVEFIRID